MKNNENTITDIWYYTNESRKKYYDMEVFFFKLKKYKVPLRAQINFSEHKFYKCNVDYKLYTKKSIVNNTIEDFKKLELYEIEFEEKYKSLFKYIVYLDKNLILFYNKTAEKLFPMLLEGLKTTIKGDQL